MAKYYLNSIPEISKNIQNRIKQTLGPNEELVWMDKPSPVIYSVRDLYSGLPSLIINILLLSIILNPPSYAWTQLSTGLNMYHFVYPVVVLIFSVAISMILVPFKRYLQNQNTVYILTNTRAIIFIGRKNIKTAVYKPENPREIYISNKKNGIADVVIHTEHEYSSGIAGSTSQIIEYGFLRIKQAEKVLELVRELALKYNIAKNAKHPPLVN